VQPTPILSLTNIWDLDIQATNPRGELSRKNQQRGSGKSACLINGDPLSEVVALVRQSRAYQDYYLAFTKALKLPLELSSVNENGQAKNVCAKAVNPFCAILAKAQEICASCPQVHRSLSYSNIYETQTIRCFTGFTITSVPVTLDDQVIGFLQTGTFLRNPNAERFRKIASRLTSLGVKVDFSRLENAYFNSRVVPPDSYRAIARLLGTCATHLDTIAGEIAVQQCHQDPPLIKRAKEYVASHLSDRIKLGKIARVLNVSPFHFCRTFKQATGQTFVEYLSRVRVHRAKMLLRSNGLRISEIAYEIGFQTLTHFNRTFRKLAGCSPTEYRSRSIAPGMQGKGTIKGR
jgi:AraC-like DNA-binding protein/ligand-binding sensor protein